MANYASVLVPVGVELVGLLFQRYCIESDTTEESMAAAGRTNKIMMLKVLLKKDAVGKT